MTNEPKTPAARNHDELVEKFMAPWILGAHQQDADDVRESAKALIEAVLSSATPATYIGSNVAERLESMADDQLPGSQVQSDLYAAATAWRKHIAPKAAQPAVAPAAPAAVAETSEFPHEQMDAIALARYKVVPSNASMFWSHAVAAGDGTQQLYVGREAECQNMARKFAGAFLDGAFEFHSIAAAHTTQAAPRPAAQQGKPSAYALKWPNVLRINLSTVFDTEAEAQAYLKRCTPGVVMVPLYANPAAPVVQGDALTYERGYRDGYERRDAEVKGALV